MPTPAQIVRVVVVGSDPLARAGLAALLSRDEDCEVVGLTDPDEIGAGPQTFNADAAVWDVDWRPAEILEQLADAVEVGPQVVALVADEAGAAGACAAGALGVLGRVSDTDALMAAVRAVGLGLSVGQPGLESNASGRATASLSGGGDLTPREIEVLRLVAEGLPNKAVAARLGISEHTVKFHINAIFTKLGAQSRTEAVTRATRRGLLPL